MIYQEEQEILFWKDLFDKNGPMKFKYIRHGDLIGKTVYFPDMFEETGRGLDYGCALCSIFEYSDLNMVAYDPLLKEFDKIYSSEYGKMSYYDNTKSLKNESFDFIACINVIDHTLDPQVIIDDLLRLLKPGGRLYFEVNFDPEIFAPHHTLWRMDTVRKYLKPEQFELVRENVHVNPKWAEQSNYEAVYIKK